MLSCCLCKSICRKRHVTSPHIVKYRSCWSFKWWTDTFLSKSASYSQIWSCYFCKICIRLVRNIWPHTPPLAVIWTDRGLPRHYHNKRPKGPLSLTWVQSTLQKFDFGMEPKTTTLHPTCFKITATVCIRFVAITFWAEEVFEMCHLLWWIGQSGNFYSLFGTKNTNLVEDVKGPTLSPAYPRIGYITLSCQSQLTGLNCLWSAKYEMRVHRGDYRKTGAEVLRRIFECGEKRNTFIFFVVWIDF